MPIRTVSPEIAASLLLHSTAVFGRPRRWAVRSGQTFSHFGELQRTRRPDVEAYAHSLSTRDHKARDFSDDHRRLQLEEGLLQESRRREDEDVSPAMTDDLRTE
ncbi:uncharacterized protein LOC122053963 [Zingiber officinale]|uniref:uncharacterized protein LOC122053963 n=1 Tax=Zingiber officinale TaxID=94328 RepID=UPI001C4C2FD2|nr:uncharacterized protein LOC122053963 [Zingiber officinale]